MANHLDTRKITFWGKSQPYELSLIQKLNFGIDKTFRALKIVAWPFSTHHVDINKRLNIDYALPFKSNQKVFRFVEFKISFLLHVILQHNGHNQFPTTWCKSSQFRNACAISRKRIWAKVFKNGPSKIYGRQPLKNLKWYGLLRQTISFQIF